MKEKYICTKCGFVGYPKEKVKGSILIEIILWFCLIIPGFIYSLWRLGSKHSVCPSCNDGQTMILLSSPVGKKLSDEFKGSEKLITEVKRSKPLIFLLWVAAFCVAILVIGIIAVAWQILLGVLVVAIIGGATVFRDKVKLIKKEGIKKEIKKFIHFDIEFIRMVGLWVGLFFALVLIAWILAYWYYSIIVGLGIWILTRKNIAKKNKIIIACILAVVIAAIALYGNYLNRSPIIKELSPEDGFAIEADKVIIKGKVDPENSKVTINGVSVPVSSGSFEYEAEILEEENGFNVLAKNEISRKTTNKTIKVKRIFTAAELEERRIKKEQERIKKEEEEKQARIDSEKRVKEIEAEMQAEENAWLSSPAGKACSAHPEWLKQECIHIADKNIWIGMSYDMLVYMRGAPDATNVSNYGYGDRYQYCWFDYTPSCFYDDNRDDLMDSYN